MNTKYEQYIVELSLWGIGEKRELVLTDVYKSYSKI